MSQRETLAIPVAGICNLHVGALSTADAHFTLIRNRLERQDIPVAPAVVPHGLGLLHSLERTYTDVEADILETADRYPDHDVILVAHSLGGMLGREFLGRQQFKDSRFVGMVALGSPFGPLKNYSGIWGAEHKAGDINEFNANGTALMPGAEGGPHITQIATSADMVVPPMSGLTPTPHATPDLHLFTTPLEFWRAHIPGATIHHYVSPLDHNGMLLAPTIDALGFHFESPADIVAHSVLAMAERPAVILESEAVMDRLTARFTAMPFTQI